MILCTEIDHAQIDRLCMMFTKKGILFCLHAQRLRFVRCELHLPIVLLHDTAF
jgi:hypothetical protein